jgi:molybdopterin biosynthesis enzyme
VFVATGLLARQGAEDPLPRYVLGVTSSTIRRNLERDEFVRARQVDRDAVLLEPISGQESHMIARAGGADALVHVPRGEGELAAESLVRFLLLG